MEPHLEFYGLDGRNPIGYFAALGALSALTRVRPDRDPRLLWTVSHVPRPVLCGFDDVGDVVSALDEDRRSWSRSSALFFGEDLKFSIDDQSRYLRACRCADDGGRSSALSVGLVAEGAMAAGKGNGKPTDLDFTAGPQKFLKIAQALQRSVNIDHLRMAICGPWKYASHDGCGSFGWDVSDDHIYALSVNKPGNSKETVPGADWLALLGLAAYPVANRGHRSLTAASGGTWNEGTFSWPLWHAPLSWNSTFSLINSDEISQRSAHLGVFRMMSAPIWRGRKGQGYGQFAPASVLWESVAQR